MTATKILHEVCSIPTAPFLEGRVIDYVERFARAHRKLRLKRDEWGNILLELPGRRRSPRWIFAAHMDHPGFVAREMLDRRTLRATFHGGVLSQFVPGAKVRFFQADGRELTGTVTETTAAEGERSAYLAGATLRVRETVEAGALGMFDQGEGRVRGSRFHCRVCDNLAGAAAALAMIDELHRRPPEATVCVLLTRAEETGFTGAIAAATRAGHPQLLRKTDRLIIIECSAEQPYARQSDGCIIRVGDKTSIFNSDLTYFITHQAEELARNDRSFRYQRALMPGGTCEATVYDLYGFVAASICVPLGNYHNMDRARAGRHRIGPEHVHLDDWSNMLKLFLHLARTAHTHKPGNKLLKDRLQKRFNTLKHLLCAPHPV